MCFRMFCDSGRSLYNWIFLLQFWLPCTHDVYGLSLGSMFLLPLLFGSLVVPTQIYVSHLGADYVWVVGVVEPGVYDENDWFFGEWLVRTILEVG